MNITKSCLHRVWECFATFSAKEMALKQTLFCRTSFMEHFLFHTNLKFNWENLIFHLCPNVAIFLKMYLFSRIGHLKKIILKGRGFRCGSDEKMMRMWFGLENDVVGLPPLAQHITNHLDIIQYSLVEWSSPVYSVYIILQTQLPRHRTIICSHCNIKICFAFLYSRTTLHI